MHIIQHTDIQQLQIRPRECVEWIRESFGIKKQATLPTKISVHPRGEDFFNTMPCLLPPQSNGEQIFGVKIVNRIVGNTPSLSSEIFLYDAQSGELKSIVDGDWIITMRTGAVATLSAQLFRAHDDVVYGFIGLGNTARATLLCLLDAEPEQHHEVLLLRYKDQAEQFIERFCDYDNVRFDIIDDVTQLVNRSGVVISCLTAAPQLLCPDDNLFGEGIVVIAVHTRGFQNCDLFFDRVVCDDTGHVSNFRYFDRFHNLCEMSDVLNGSCPDRQSAEERILCYNIGIGLHDVFFASRILHRMKGQLPEIVLQKEHTKFWV